MATRDSSADVVFTRVLIVGAGPVGLTLAMELAHRGIDVLVVEQRRADETSDALCNELWSRTMEVFRRLGLAESIRATGTAPEHREIPDWPTPEPSHRIDQAQLMPLLSAQASAQQRIQIYHGTCLDSAEQDHTGVASIVTDLDTNAQYVIHAEFILGCDGADSQVREFIGAQVSDRVAERFRDGRAFIAGEAAHPWGPRGDIGVNVGIADAANLGFVIGGYLSGWGDEGLLDAYERERRPIAEQVARLLGDVAPGQQPEVGAGLNFGYYYDASPVIVYDGAPQPPYTLHAFEPSTVPGCRAPHVWLGPERSLYDQLAPAFTLLRTDPGVNVQAMLLHAQKRGLPFKLIDVAADVAGPAYVQVLTLVRADQFVVWRGAAPPEDPRPLLDALRGAASWTRGMEPDVA